MIDWKHKLTSRKFWAAIAGFVSMLIVFFGGAQELATQVTSLIMAGASVIAYILAEGFVDANGNAGEAVPVEVVEEIKIETPDAGGGAK